MRRLATSLSVVLASAILGVTAPCQAQRFATVRERGEVRFARFYSPALGVPKGYMVYLPPSSLKWLTGQLTR
jgi:hypothetical protein